MGIVPGAEITGKASSGRQHKEHKQLNTQQHLIKIAVVGPESTGKSTMSTHLAQAWDTVCVPEYARYYCQNLNNQYTLQDEVNMFYGQVALEESLLPLAKQNLLVCDTTIMTIKIWSDHLFGSTPSEVVNEIDRRAYDLYLLMDIDLPWEDDPLRDFPNERPHFMEVWKKELDRMRADYVIINGSGDQRLENGFEAVKTYLTTTK